ncbi:MAG: ketopantoate reductase family protein [Terriglobales bacterium]
MKHAILGAGAIGGLMGTALASIGEDVTVVVRPDKIAGYPERLTLEQPGGTITAPARAVAKLTDPVDVLWIATKTFQLAEALKAVEAEPRMVIPLLNGTDHVTWLRKKFGEARVVPGTIAIEAERAAPGVFVQRAPVVRLNLAGSAEPRLSPIVARLAELGFASQFIGNEATLLWSKLCFLGPLALVTSASGKNKGEVFADERWRERLHDAVRETCAVAQAEGTDIQAEKIWSVMENAPTPMRSSMQKDMAAGRPLELDAIGGTIVRHGEQHGIAAPTIESLMGEIADKAAA